MIWPSRSYAPNIPLSDTLRYISILPVIPVTLHLSPQEAIDTRHPQDTHHAPPPSIKTLDLQTDLTLYKSVLHFSYLVILPAFINVTYSVTNSV